MRQLSKTLFSLAFVAIAAGCAGTPPIDGGGNGGAGGGSTCDASPPSSDSGSSCPAPASCQPFSMTLEGFLSDANALTDARCVLRALRDATPGEYAFTVSGDGGYHLENHSLTIQADGQVQRTVHIQIDKSSRIDSRYVLPKAPSFYNLCVGFPPGPLLLNCLTDFPVGMTQSGNVGDRCASAFDCRIGLLCCEGGRCAASVDGSCPAP